MKKQRTKKLKRKRPRKIRPKKKRIPILRAKQEFGSFFASLFGATPRVRLLQFFFRNEYSFFPSAVIAETLGLEERFIKKEAEALTQCGVLSARGPSRRRRWRTNSSFQFLPEFERILRASLPLSRARIVKMLQGAGSLRLVLVSGVFLNQPQSAVDLFVVADRLNQTRFQNAVRRLEAIIGKELRWAAMGNEEFAYRMNMLDRFILDIMSGPHEKLLISKLKLP